MIEPYKLIRSARKTLSISIDPLGRLIVRAPTRYSERRIYDFLQKKQSWILRKQAQRTGAESRLPTEKLDGFSFLYLGEPHVISLYGGKKVRFDESGKRFFVPQENAKDKLVKWLKAEAKKRFLTWTEEEAAKMGATFKSVGVSSAKTRWGSCSADNFIRYSFRLLYAPESVVRAVIAHELAHTRVKNHSAVFWAELEKYEPEYKQKRKWLKDHAYLMEIF